MNLTARARLAAATCLGLTPQSTAAAVRAATADLTDDLSLAIQRLNEGEGTGDVLLDRKLRAAHLLLCNPATHRAAHLHLMHLFLRADAAVPESQRSFQALPTQAPTRRASGAREPDPAAPPAAHQLALV